MRAHHDMGGLPSEPINRADHVLAPWEKRVHAILNLLSNKGIMNVHELRRGIEAIGADEYDRLAYYERWITSICNNMVQKGIFSVDELGRKLAEIEAREAKS